MAKQKKKISSILPDKKIIRKIYVIRDQKVMLDFDLAALYEVETKALNQAVKRNADRFPEDFMFRLTTKEWLTMRSQFVTSSSQNIDIQARDIMRSQNVTASMQNIDSQSINEMRSQIATASQKKRNTTITPYALLNTALQCLQVY